MHITLTFLGALKLKGPLSSSISGSAFTQFYIHSRHVCSSQGMRICVEGTCHSSVGKHNRLLTVMLSLQYVEKELLLTAVMQLRIIMYTYKQFTAYEFMYNIPTCIIMYSTYMFLTKHSRDNCDKVVIINR